MNATRNAPIVHTTCGAHNYHARVLKVQAQEVRDFFILLASRGLLHGTRLTVSPHTADDTLGVCIAPQDSIDAFRENFHCMHAIESGTSRVLLHMFTGFAGRVCDACKTRVVGDHRTHKLITGEVPNTPTQIIHFADVYFSRYQEHLHLQLERKDKDAFAYAIHGTKWTVREIAAELTVK